MKEEVLSEAVVCDLGLENLHIKDSRGNKDIIPYEAKNKSSEIGCWIGGNWCFCVTCDRIRDIHEVYILNNQL